MGQTLLITFRESLEAALVIGIVLGIIKQGGRPGLRSSVWVGLVAGLVCSVVAAYAFIRALGQFEGREEQIFEGSVMAFGSILLATLILWTGSHAKGSELSGKAGRALNGGWLAIATLVFTSVLREGVETVIYLGDSLMRKEASLVLAGLIGLGLAVAAGFLFFAGGRRMSSGLFLQATSTLLLLFGAGMFARALGEFGEAGLVPPLVEPLWSIAPAREGLPVPLMNDEGGLGSFLHGLFGYISSPSLTEVLGYLAYAAAILLVLWGRGRRRYRA
ncbi:MAG TPA: FTR1 family protein [Rectinemataceae bacterium]|nr:FTR1 family protein [Rectinemataceae bacterium]